MSSSAVVILPATVGQFPVSLMRLLADQVARDLVAQAGSRGLGAFTKKGLARIGATVATVAAATTAKITTAAMTSRSENPFFLFFFILFIRLWELSS